MAKTPTWQRAEGKNPEGGLNEKGRASLKAEGHDIKRPQPEGGSRRDSFCARMKGMKSKLTSSETANDPDSRINKSLRKWNCADGGAVDPYDSVQQAAKGGPIWDKPRPKKLGKPEPLSPKEKASAKAAAKAAGRPYPNLIDNMRAARADGGELEGDVQFAPDDPYAKVQEAAKLPMMAQHEYAMRMPEPEVRYDTGPQPGEATLKWYDPTIRERIYQGIAGTEERPSPERAQFARGMSQMAEFAPVLGNVMAGQEAQRRGDTKGMLMAALPVPGMATEARMAEAAAGPAQQAAQEAYQRVLNAQGLYSHAAEAAANLPQAKGSYEQMMAMLQKAGVKPEEMRWSGVEQFAGQPVTREQLVQHFEQGVPKIEETVFGGKKPYAAQESAYTDALLDALNDVDRPDLRTLERQSDLAEREARKSGYIPTKFQQYTIPGGQNYREVLLGLPSETKRLEARRREIEALGRNATEEQKSEWANIMNRLQPDDRDIEGISRYRGPAAEGEYQSPHWENYPNVLGHLRLSDRTGPQGEKILHMEELQSDWGQQGRQKGFTPDTKGWTTKEAKTGWGVYDETGKFMGNALKERQSTPEEAIKFVAHNQGNPPRAPYVESTKNWVDLGLKRALKEAAEKGYDKLVWTPGAEQAARYDLSQQIGSITARPTPDGKIHLEALTPDMGSVVHNGVHKPNDLDNIVGKEIADKIRGQVEFPTSFDDPGKSAELSGLDLKVGGEGMKSFYDSIIPSRLKELMKKIDPQAKVQLGSHPISKDGEEVRAHSIQITPKMREAILKGLPAYAKGGEVVNDTDPYDNIRDASKNFPRARRASH